MNNAEKALQLAEEIANTRNKLKQLEAEFASFFVVSPIAVNADNEGLESDKPSAASLIRGFFETNPNKSFSLADLREKFPSVSDATLRGTINRLVHKSKELKAVARGQYGLRK